MLSEQSGRGCTMRGNAHHAALKCQCASTADRKATSVYLGQNLATVIEATVVDSQSWDAAAESLHRIADSPNLDLVFFHVSAERIRKLLS